MADAPASVHFLQGARLRVDRHGEHLSPFIVANSPALGTLPGEAPASPRDASGPRATAPTDSASRAAAVLPSSSDSPLPRHIQASHAIALHLSLLVLRTRERGCAPRGLQNEGWNRAYLFLRQDPAEPPYAPA